jgi:hypothetical protein
MRTSGGNWSNAGQWLNAPSVTAYPNNGNLGKTYDAVVALGFHQSAVLDIDVTLDNLTLGGDGALTTGTGTARRTVVVNDTFTFGSGALSANIGARNLAFPAGTFPHLNAALSVSGRVTDSNAAPYTQMDVGTGRLTLQLTARFDVTSTFVLWKPNLGPDPGYSGTNGSLVNFGVIDVGAAGKLWSVTGWSATNSGAVSVAGELKAFTWNNAGTIDLTAADAVAMFERSSLGGSIRLAPGSRLRLAHSQYGVTGNVLAGPAITNAGTIVIDGPVQVTKPTTIPGVVAFGTNAGAVPAGTNVGGLWVRADTTFTGPVVIEPAATRDYPLVTADADVTFSGPTTLVTWLGGTGRVTATDFTFRSGRIGVRDFLVPAGGHLTLPVQPAGSGARELLGANLRAEGRVEWAGGRVTSIGVAASYTSRVEIAPGGTLHVAPAAVATLSQTNTTTSRPADTLLNRGLIHVDGGSFETDWRVTNAATIRVENGSLTLRKLADNSGTIRVDAGFLRLATPPSGTGAVELGLGGLALLGNVSYALAETRSQIVRGRSASPVTGPSIRAVPADGGPDAVVGYMRVMADGVTVRGVPVGWGEVVVANTIAGDATLDGVVDFADLVRLAQNYEKLGRPAVAGDWYDGDFTYSGGVNFDDLVLLAQNYEHAAPAGPVPGAAPGFEAEMARAFATVPEPSSAALVAVAGLGLLARARRVKPPL